MKLESTLRDKPGLMQFAPLLDVVLILLVFFLLGSAFMVRSGVSVTLPRSASTLEGFTGARVLTLSAGNSPRILLDGVAVALADLEEELGRAGHLGGLVIRADELATHGLVMEVSNIAMAVGYDVALATAPPSQD